ncbi:MAG: IS4 family transposase, partial [Bacteroidales bacterium]
MGTCQNTDFDGQIADTTIVLITHTILMLQRRFEAYETMGGLFRESQQQLLELTLWDRILKIFIRMLRELLE